VYSPDLRQIAPTIVEGIVKENRIVRTQPAARLPEVLLELHVVQVSVEMAIRGGAGKREIEFYYFGESPDSAVVSPRYKRPFQADVGTRYLFFLCTENSVLRSVGDVGEYSVPVFSGAPDENEMGTSNPGRIIATILLRLGKGMIPELFASGLRSSSIAADQWGSRLLSVQLLRNLLKEGEPIRTSACAVLYSRYNGQSDCQYGIDQSPDAAREPKFVDFMQNARDSQLLAKLESGEPFDFPMIGKIDSRKRILEELESIQESVNPALRRAACNALYRYFNVGTGICK
jgi:hypothetical protein